MSSKLLQCSARAAVIVCLVAAAWSLRLHAQTPALADPMRPATRSAVAGAGAGAAAPLRLQGIVIADSRRLALIDGELLREGQRIHGVSIVRIDADVVTVRRDETVFVLRPETAAPLRSAESGESR